MLELDCTPITSLNAVRSVSYVLLPDEELAAFILYYIIYCSNLGDMDNSMPETQCANDMSEDEDTRPEAPRTVDAARPCSSVPAHGDDTPVGKEAKQRVDPERVSASRSPRASVISPAGPGHSPAGARSLPERCQTSPQTGVAHKAGGTEAASPHATHPKASPRKSTDASGLDKRAVAQKEMPHSSTAPSPSTPSQTRPQPATTPRRSPNLNRPLTGKSSPACIVVDLSQEGPDSAVKKRHFVDLTANDSDGESGKPAGGKSAARSKQATPVHTPSAPRVKTPDAARLTRHSADQQPPTNIPRPLVQTPATSAPAQQSRHAPQTPASGPATPSELMRSGSKPPVLSGCKFFLTRDEELVDARGQSIGTWDTVASNIRRHGGGVSCRCPWFCRS